MPLVLLFLIAVPVSIIHQFYFVQADAFIGSVQASIVEKGAFEKTISEVFGVGGGLMTIGQMTEILVLAMMPFLTKWFTRKHLLLIGLAAYALRMALWAFMPTLPFVMAGIALHGLCFGCFIFVAFMIVDENTTGDIRATAQSLFNLVIVGIGTIVGSIVAANIVGNWASASGTMDYAKLFTVPMWMAIGCFAIILVAYPNRSKALPG
jgi:MFS family permease